MKSIVTIDRVVTRSLWLPVGSANFFSPMTDPALLDDEGGCRSLRAQEKPDYVPHLRESVMRRLVEVLPAAFEYDQVGRCEFGEGQNDRGKPIALTMTLPETVTLRVDETGFYTFTAPGDDAAALEEHIVAVFGGDFAVNRLDPSLDRRNSEGREAVKRYNGPPALGALSFHQLNVMVEGLCNQSLLPAVFFEHYRVARTWLEEYRRQSSVLTNLADFIREVLVDVDASTPAGQIATLHRFLTIARGSLQWMRRSVESVRRSLLDQMMAVSHRQARLIQLDLAGVEYERTPEMTGEATESQMRGYVMLVATKLPLLFTVADGASEAVASLEKRTAYMADGMRLSVAELASNVDGWRALLKRLGGNVRSLETAVEHDWQERLLYEQEQARSEQEAMAEIERSRRGRPESQRMGDVAYNALMLVLTVVAVFVAIQTADNAKPPKLTLEWVVSLLPIMVLSLGFFLVWPMMAAARRLFHQRTPNSETYSYEFAFRLDERSDAKRVREFLTGHEPQDLATKAFRGVKMRRLGGWRVERISSDTTLLKVHSVAVVKLRWLRYARFEIVTEVMVRRISDEDQFFLRQCRMFGDSPVPLGAESISALVTELLDHACRPLSDELDLEELSLPSMIT